MKSPYVVFSAACLALSAQVAPGAETADAIYHNGTVLTINDAAPTAEAVAVKDGRILAVGQEAEVRKTAGGSTREIDLGGNTMLPGFVDSHGHVYLIGIQATTANLLPPPDGTGKDIASLQSLLTDWAANNSEFVEKVGWIAGFGYDDSQLAEQRHPTRDELDKVSTDLPVLIFHQSGHLGVANSKALEIAGVTAETKDPEGGVFRRKAGSQEPNGVMEEYAFFLLVSKLMSHFDNDVNDALVLAGTRLDASFGYTTAQEGRAMGSALEAMRRVADSGGLAIDLVAYPDVLEVDDVNPSRGYTNHYRVGGVKLTIDGSPQGKTAWLTEPYYVPPEGQPEDYRGYAAIDEKTANEAVDKAYANGWQILVHANGDAASDRFIEAVRRAKKKYPDVDNRPVLIHGQVLREDQVEQLEELGIFPSLFPMHTYYWGDWHRESVLGPERAENISPTGWVLERGMMFGSHHDAPVALPDSMRVLSATVTRKSRSGRVLGPEHRVPVATALKALTIWPAWQHFEEDTKGSIEVGKLADFVILSDNPLTVPEDQLADLKVLETIKEGKSIYQRPEGEVVMGDEMKAIEGSVWYRERMALPPNAGIQITLEDVARMDVASDVVATTRIVPQGGPPWTFSLAYDPGKLHDKGRYVLRARIEADGKLLFINTAQIPAFDGDAGSPIQILVSRVGAKAPADTESAHVPDVSLTNTDWKLIEIDGHPAIPGAGGRELNMVFASEGAAVHGFSGCNRFAGSYELNESQLKFTPLATTRMACTEGMEQEQRFLEALGQVVRFTLSGADLALYGGEERLLLRFRALATQ